MNNKTGQEFPTQVGTGGEDLVYKYLSNRYGKGKVQDLRKDQGSMNRDIDYSVNGVTYEVKTDTRIANTNNFAFEIRRDNDLPGCFARSKADYWIYVDSVNSIAYMFRLSDALSFMLMFALSDWKKEARAHRSGLWKTFTISCVPKDLFLKTVDHVVLDLIQKD